MQVSKIIGITCFAVFLQSCVNFKFDYKTPVNGPTAKVYISSRIEGYNMQIINHGEDLCDPNSATLVGLLNAVAIGQVKVQELEVTVTANKPVAFSMPQQLYGGQSFNSVTFNYCQPIGKFVPKENNSYVLEFDTCSVKVFEVQKTEKQLITTSESEKTCIPTHINQGKMEKLFWLTKP